MKRAYLLTKFTSKRSEALLWARAELISGRASGETFCAALNDCAGAAAFSSEGAVLPTELPIVTTAALPPALV